MIRISCTNCKTILSIDDAFAGGVCRCQHCGTIQTVPAQMRGGAAVGVSGQSIGGMKSHYQNGNDSGTGTGLDDLAGIVVSSGLSSSRLKRPSRDNTKRKPPNVMLIVAIAGVVVIVLVFVIILLVMHNNSTAANQTGQTTATQLGISNSPAAVTKGPSFCGAPLGGSTIIYLLDCGGTMQDYLGDLKDVTIKSLGSLDSSRKFQILFWNNGTDGAYPENTTTYANQDSITAAQKAIDEVAPFGQTDIMAGLKLAVAQHPDAIVIATGKGWELDNAWYDNVMAIRNSAPIKFHTFNLGSSGESPPMKKLASTTGGTYRELSKTDLRSFGE